MIELDKIYNEDCLVGMQRIPDETVDCVVTSPPYYGLRDYGVDGQIGLEESPEEYIGKLVKLFQEVLRVMKPSGTCWLVIGDSYAGSNKSCATDAKDRDLIGIPWMLAFALRDLGFYLRQDIIWHKPNPMPESVTSRCTRSHEYIFMLTKSAKYYFNTEALREPANTGVRPNEYNHRKVKFVVPGHKNEQFRGGNVSDGFRNKRDVWSICVEPGYEGHHAAFPLSLPRQCILLGCPTGG